MNLRMSESKSDALTSWLLRIVEQDTADISTISYSNIIIALLFFFVKFKKKSYIAGYVVKVRQSAVLIYTAWIFQPFTYMSH